MKFVIQKYNTKEEAKQCELIDTNLTEEEYNIWWELKSDVSRTSRVDYSLKEKLLSFEKEHNLSREQIKKNMSERK